MDLLHALSLGDLLREHRRSNPLQIACVSGDERFTYRELDDRVNRLSHTFLAAGVGRGDRILWLGQNSHRLLEGLLAAAKLGAIFSPLNWRWSAEELAFALSDAMPTAVLWQQDEIGEQARKARALTKADALWIQHDDPGPEGYEARLTDAEPGDPALEVDPGLPVLALYTGAFGGHPHASLLGHDALLLQGLVVSKVQDVGRESIYLNSGPLFHVATFMTTMATFVWGGTNVFTPRVEAETLCRLIDAERCTGAFVVGPTLQQMVEANADGRYDLSSLRSFRAFPAWDSMTTPDGSPWGRRPGGYGQTELMGLATLSCLGMDATGSHGRPSPLAQVRIVDPEGVEVSAGESGEIVVRGPTVMLGYWRRDALEARRRAGDWHHTGDLGRREEDGSITFIGPAARLIKSAAENIYPVEVERCIAAHPAVAECAVIGKPDPEWGQRVAAIVVLRDGVEADAEAIVEHCRAHIASYKKPREVAFVESLPKRGFAVDHDALDRRFGGGGYPGAAAG